TKTLRAADSSWTNGSPESVSTRMSLKLMFAPKLGPPAVSKDVFQRNLHLPSRPGIKYSAVIWLGTRVDVLCRRSPLRVVESIEHIPSELDLSRFPREAGSSALVKGHIPA